jgi:hypothetical protein
VSAARAGRSWVRWHREQGAQLTAEPAEPSADWTDELDPSLDTDALVQLGERRAVLEQQLREDGASARLRAAQAKLDADYRTERARLQAEARARSAPRPAPVVVPTPPVRPSPTRSVSSGSFGSCLVDRCLTGVMVVAALLIFVSVLVGPGAGAAMARSIGETMGVGIGVFVGSDDKLREGFERGQREAEPVIPGLPQPGTERGSR